LKPFFEKNGREIGSIMTFTDITTQKKFMEKLERLATIDELTGIYNRRHLMELADIEIQRFARSRLHLAMLILDLDHFKVVNDTWGHHSGDRVLKAFAVSVRQNIRAMDIFGRFGGEEFMIIMPDTSEAVALETAKRICSLVENLSVSFDETAIRFTVSIGVSGTWNRENPDLEMITQEADKALYAAKKNGRNQVVLG
ncbi:MAG: GGDEF domain-containing protein, partial [Desulfobacterales bacterium]|nr:GGDEF domain-containing protein [Desulfobacterales bacterium]